MRGVEDKMKKPNIVFILIDDLGWRDLECYGSDFYETPCIDKLAREGMMFTNAYASCPVCSPTRASLLTGKYPARLGLTDYISGPGVKVESTGYVGGNVKGKLVDVPYIHYLDNKEYCMPKAFRDAGYSTWHIGKWHLGGNEYLPENQGFDVNIGGWEWGRPMHGYFSPWQLPTLPDKLEGEYLTDRITEEAIELLKGRDKEKPFFMYLSHYAVHTPIQAKPEDISYFQAKAKRLHRDEINPLVKGEKLPYENKRNGHVVRRVTQSDVIYAAMIRNLDMNIGKLLTELKAEEIYDDTIVIFTSDNGGLSTTEGAPTCNAPLSEGKGWMYDGGVREPLIIRYPSLIQKSTICDTPVTTPDFYPTLLDLTKIPQIPSQHVDGKSFIELLKGNEVLENRPIFWHYPHYGNQGGTPGCSVRKGNYKLIEFFEEETYELYNLKEDISESNNLIEKEPQKFKELKKLLDEWKISVNAQIPIQNPDWKTID